jgi:hypothetical protein
MHETVCLSRARLQYLSLMFTIMHENSGKCLGPDFHAWLSHLERRAGASPEPARQVL